MTVSTLQLDNEFWLFSLSVYDAAGVEPECLALHETLGIDVNLLLFCAWLGAARRIALTESDIERARLVVQSWHKQVVRPLRTLRQQLKFLPEPEIKAYRSRVKALELDAEQLEEAMLFGHAQLAWPRTIDGDPRDIVPANVRIFLQAQRSDRLVAGDALSTGRLINAAIKAAG